MATANPRPRLRQVSLWRRPLLVGVCFGLGYGLTQRLLDLRLPGLVQWGQSFDVRDFPGTSLESLRLRFGSDAQELRGRLDLLELEPAKPDTDLQPPALSEGDGASGAAQAPAGQDAVTPASPTAAPPAPALPPPTISQP